MASVFAKSMLESSIVVSDWLLSCQQIRSPKRFNEIFKELYATFRNRREDENVYHLLLSCLNDVFDVLADGLKNGFIKPATVAPGGSVVQKTEAEKPFGDLLREAEDFLMYLLVLARTLDDTAIQNGKPEAARHLYNVIDTLGPLTVKDDDDSQNNTGCSSRDATTSSSAPASSDTTAVPQNHGGSIGFEDLRLRIMMCGFDMTALDSPFRYDAMLRITEFASSANLFDKLLPYLSNMERWVEKDYSLTHAQRRKLLILIATQLRERPALKGTLLNVVTKIVQEYDSEPLNSTFSAEATEFSVEALSLSISLMDVVTYDTILQSRSVQQLQNTEHAPLLKLAHIFYAGDHKDFAAFQDMYPQVFGTYDLDPEKCFDKIRLLVLVSMASSLTPDPKAALTVKGQRLSLADVAERLQISASEAEELAVHAISLGLLDGQIDQMNAEIAVRSSLQRSFGKAQWLQLKDRLTVLKTNVTQVLSHMEKHQQRQHPTLFSNRVGSAVPTL